MYYDEPKQAIKGGEKSICPSCYHFDVCRGIVNQPCVECNQYKDLRQIRLPVFCAECAIHGKCSTEDVFIFAGAGLKDTFCWAGRKQK